VTTLGALFYADARSFVNQLRDIRNSAARAVLWFVFALSIASVIALRVINASHRSGYRGRIAAGELATDAIVCGALMLFGAALAVGNRYAGLFANPAEARFIIGSPATPFIATLYVQVRQIVRGSARQALGLLYVAFVYLPPSLGAGTLARDVVLIVAAFVLIASVPLARQLLAARFVPLAVAGGWLCIVLAPLPPLRDAAARFAGTLPAAAVLLRLPAWHPGRILLANASLQIEAIAVLLACAGMLFVCVARVARDAYPELYELSMKRFARTERLRSRPFSAPAPVLKAPVRSESMAAGAPSGVAIFVWRAWTEYRRTHDTRAAGLETALLLVAGYALARLTATVASDVLIVVVSPLVNIIFILAVMRSASLANELRRPLFWLSDATLFERLCALAVAQGWRVIGWCVLAGIGLASGGAPVAFLVAMVVVAPSAVLLASAIGYASYALLPNDIDQQGPLRFLRLLLGYVLVIPPIAVGIMTGIFERGAAIALGNAAATTLVEAAVLLGFAAWRLDRMSISLR
jgi:hypothetical protein